MSEQHHMISSHNKGEVPWWVRLCRWLWKHPLSFLWSTLIINVTINIGSTWLITPSDTKAIPDNSAVGRVVGWMSAHWLFSLLLGTISITLLLLTWMASRWPNPASSTHDQAQMSAHDRVRMLRRLRFRYEQMLAQSLQGVVQMELGLVSQPTAVYNAASLALHLPDQPDQPLPAHTSIIDAYELAQQDLLILGQPGAGKSTLLLELARHLVQQAEQDATQPLPVLLPLSSWATNQPPLLDWFIGQFALLYNVPLKLSQQWIAAEQLLPLLDGLDEMEESVRADCIGAINIYHKDYLQPLVVCSRTDEYQVAARQEKLALHTAVVVQPLLRAQVDTYLKTLGKPLAALRSALHKNAALQEIATTPLMLQVLLLTYHGTLVRELSHKQTQLQEQIWTDYVQYVVSRKGDATRYPLAFTTQRLSWLARQMQIHSQTIFFLEQLQPDWLPKRLQALYQWTIGLASGLAFGLIVGLIIGLGGGQGSGQGGGLRSGLFLGLTFGLVFGLRQKIEPTEVLTWSWKKVGIGLSYALVIALIIVPIFALVIAPILGLALVPVVGLVIMPVFVLVVVLLFGFSERQLTERLMLSPNEGIHRSIKNGLLFVLLGALIGGPIIGLLTGQVIGLAGGPVGRLIGGLFGGILFSVPFFGLDAALQHYFLRFWLRGSHPLRAVPFLEDATARILLRRVGGGYSFIHRLLLDYFANLDTTTSSTSPNAHPMQPPPLP